MPYNITKKGEKYFVQNATTGRVLGTHPTKAKADAHMRAMYANTDDMKGRMKATTKTA